jgi:signal transduction histidine kinase
MLARDCGVLFDLAPIWPGFLSGLGPRKLSAGRQWEQSNCRISSKAGRASTMKERDLPQQVQVSVSDCGAGISSDADRLFNAFFTTKPSGMGMGLSVCRSIVGAHGGRLWSTASLPQGAPQGATFHFTVPVRADIAS